MEKPLLDLQVQKPIAVKNFHDNSAADLQDSSVLGIRGSKPIVHFGGSTVKKISTPEIDSGSSSTAFNSAGKPQPQQHARRDRDRDKTDMVDAKADSSSVNTTEDGSSIASSMPAAPTIPKVNFDDLCLQHVVGGGGFGQVSKARVYM